MELEKKKKSFFSCYTDPSTLELGSWLKGVPGSPQANRYSDKNKYFLQHDITKEQSNIMSLKGCEIVCDVILFLVSFQNEIFYMIFQQIVMGCNNFIDICKLAESSVRLEFRRNPSIDKWDPVESVCLPGSQNSGLCNPHFHHRDSHYTISQVPTWTRITVPLAENTFSG